jgi:hypothetical protein
VQIEASSIVSTVIVEPHAQFARSRADPSPLAIQPIFFSSRASCALPRAHRTSSRCSDPHVRYVRRSLFERWTPLPSPDGSGRVVNPAHARTGQMSAVSQDDPPSPRGNRARLRQVWTLAVPLSGALRGILRCVIQAPSVCRLLPPALGAATWSRARTGEDQTRPHAPERRTSILPVSAPVPTRKDHGHNSDRVPRPPRVDRGQVPRSR